MGGSNPRTDSWFANGEPYLLSGVKVIQTQIRQPSTLEPGQAQQLQVPISISPANLGLAFFNMLKGDGAGYEITGAMDLETQFGNLRLPYQTAGRTAFSH